MCMCGVSVRAGEPASLLGADDLYEGGRGRIRGVTDRSSRICKCVKVREAGVWELRDETETLVS